MGGLAPCQWANAYTRFGEIWLDKCGHPLDKCGHQVSAASERRTALLTSVGTE